METGKQVFKFTC